MEEKNGMRKPPTGNVPVRMNRGEGHISISGRLSKPANKGNIAYDPV